MRGEPKLKIAINSSPHLISNQKLNFKLHFFTQIFSAIKSILPFPKDTIQ